jgi:hypothetical protein
VHDPKLDAGASPASYLPEPFDPSTSPATGQAQLWPAGVGYGAVRPNRPPRRGWLVAVVVVLAVIAAVAYLVVGTSSGGSHQTAQGLSPTPPGMQPTVASPSMSFAALEAKLLTAAPAGFVVQPDSVFDTGPSDLAKAIRDDRHPDAARVLINDQFLQGYQRLWLNRAQDQVIVFLYQFGSPTGAAAYYQRSVRLLDQRLPRGSQHIATTPLPPRDSLGLTGTVRGHSFAVVLAHTRSMIMQVVCNATTRTDLRQRARDLATEQFNRL